MSIDKVDPHVKVKEFERSHGLIVRSANFILYGDISNRVVQIVRRYCNDIEVYSIDESFLFLDGYPDQVKRMRELRKRVFRGLDLPTSVGIANTKTLAKVANKIAKKYPERTGSVYSIDTPAKITAALKWFPIEDVWGIGRRYYDRFQRYGVHTAWDFTQLPDDFLRDEMGIYGVRMKKELLGDRQYEMTISEPKKNIEFDGYFQEKWEIESEFPVSFDEEYFENENRSELYVYLAAMVDDEIFQYLSFAWKVFRKEELTTEVLHAEISQLKEKGVRF